MLTWAVVTPALLIVATLIFHEIMRRLLCDPSNARRAVFAGYNDVSQALAQPARASTPSSACRWSASSTTAAPIGCNVETARQLLGRLSDLADVREGAAASQVIFIALPVRHMQRVTDLLDELRDTTASIYYVPDIFVFDLIQARTGAINGIPVVAMCETPFYGYPRRGQAHDGRRHLRAGAAAALRR